VTKPQPAQNLPPISLLWPPAEDAPPRALTPRLSEQAAADLDLETTVNALSAGHGHAREIRAILLHLSDDPAVIRYRQDVIDDLLAHPELARGLDDLLPRLAELSHYRFFARPGQTPLHEVVWRVGQLEAYVECVQGLGAIFAAVDGALRAEAWRCLREQVARIEGDPLFQTLAAELPDLVASVRNIASVTIGVNLDDQLRPVEATLLSVNRKKFRGMASSLLGTLFGKNAPSAEWEGIAPLHSVPPKTAATAYGPVGIDLDNPMLYPLFRDLANVLKQASRPVAAALQRYAHVSSRALGDLAGELAFYLGAVDLMARLRAAGLPLCRPEILPAEARVCIASGTANLNLALRLLASDPGADLAAAIVLNDVCFDDAGRVFILTGPNQGGKTTYTQGVGLLHVLAQAGLPVPGTAAQISPADAIFTHFPLEEQPDSGAGRLGEEASRLSTLFERATRHSLVLLNESLSSTSFSESLYLARDVVRILRLMGVRALYATHLHELAADVDALNADPGGQSTVGSLVSLAAPAQDGGPVQQTYRIVPGPPRGLSYARDIAARYGISYDQLADLLRRRGLLRDG